VIYGLINDILLDIPYNRNTLPVAQILWADSLNLVVGMAPQITATSYPTGSHAWDDEEQAYYFIAFEKNGKVLKHFRSFIMTTIRNRRSIV